MTDFVVQVFEGDCLVAQEAVQSETWQGAHEAVQSKYPNLVVSVHSLEVYREGHPVEKLCLWCKHFYLDMGGAGYSEWTPGWDATVECVKGKWEMKEGDGQQEFRNILLTAQACELYELADSIQRVLGVDCPVERGE